MEDINKPGDHEGLPVKVSEAVNSLVVPNNADKNASPQKSLARSIKIAITHDGKSPKSAPEPQDEVYSSVLVNRFAVNFENECAYLASVDEHGNTKIPFEETMIPDPTQRYQKNELYPFSLVFKKYDYAIWWAEDQAGIHSISAPRFDDLFGRWEFPKVLMPKASMPKSEAAARAADLPMNNEKLQSVICCNDAKPRDTEKDWSIYYAILNNFGNKLIGKAPVKLVIYNATSEKKVYGSYKYYFNTIGPFHADHMKCTKFLVRSFACNTLSGNDVVEILMSPLEVCMEADVEKMGDKEYLIRLPGVGFSCPTHPRYGQLTLYWVRSLPKVVRPELFVSEATQASIAELAHKIEKAKQEEKTEREAGFTKMFGAIAVTEPAVVEDHDIYSQQNNMRHMDGFHVSKRAGGW